MPDAARSVQGPPGRLGGRGRGHPGGLSPAGAQISPGPGGDGRSRRPDGGHQCRLGADRRAATPARRSTGSEPPSCEPPSRRRRRVAAPTGSGGLPPRPSAAPRPAPAPPPEKPREPETTSGDWTPGRSTVGSGYDESMRRPQGHGAAGPPPGRPSGTTLNFGRYAGWSIGEVARHDLEYIEWLDRAPIGRNYRQEIDEILRSSGRRKSVAADASDRRGLYRRR